MKIYLDDKRDIPDGWVGARSATEFIKIILSNHNDIEAISFDNDLGAGMEGWEILKWISEQFPELFRPEIDIEIHSANSSARENMEGKLIFYREHWNELVEAKDKPSPFDELKNK